MVHSIHQEDLIVFLKDAKEDYLKYSKRKLKGANLESIVKDQIIDIVDAGINGYVGTCITMFNQGVVDDIS